LPAIYANAVSAAIDGLETEPLKGKPLRGKLRHLRSLRVGVYRVVHRVESRPRAVLVETVRHRSEAYR
jgi:mRNA-degrading endonuclease RelE of RelBE toxin-antitoxin system